MGILIIISIIAIFALIQSYINKNKIAKWLLPTMSFLFSVYIIGFIVIYELTHYINKGKNLWEIFDINRIFGMITIFGVLNIPTIIFLMINRYRRKKLYEK